MTPLKNVRRLTIGGGALVGVAIVYGLLNGLFSGFGGNGPGSGTQALVSNGNNSMSVPDASQSKPADQRSARKEETASQAVSADVVNVLIDERSYFIRLPADGKQEYRRIELPELMNLAKAARGNEDGIRVRVSRRKSSRASAENLLQEKLMEAGLRKESIHLQKGFVP